MRIVVVLAVIVAIVFYLFRSEPAKAYLYDNLLLIESDRCKLEIPVKQSKAWHEIVDKVHIERHELVLPNDDRLIYETIDFPSGKTLRFTHKTLVEKIFNMPVEEIFSDDGVQIFQGKFDIALFDRSDHDLVLLYPVDDLSQSILICVTEGEHEGVRQFSKEIFKSHWKGLRLFEDRFFSDL